MTITKSILAGVILQLALTGIASAGTVRVEFEHPEEFRDIRVSPAGDTSAHNIILSDIKDHIVQQGREILPEGHELLIVFTDIDLAGAREPWRGPSTNDIPFTRGIYPPSVEFRYELRDAGGRIVSNGKQTLTDLNFERKTRARHSNRGHWVKRMLRDWLNNL